MNYKHLSAKFFTNNKYSKWYFTIVDSAIAANRQKGIVYFERHHILPKSKNLWPEFASLKLNPWNGVLLTPREHFVCHRLLSRMTSGKAKASMVFGLRRLCFGNEAYVSNKCYEKIRVEFMKMNSGESHPSYGTKASPETRARQSASHKGTVFSSEHKQKIGEANANRIWTAESKAKASQSAKLKVLSASHKANISKVSVGTKNAMAGTKWMSHPIGVSKPVKAFSVADFSRAGWVFGQSKPLNIKENYLANRLMLDKMSIGLDGVVTIIT